MVIEHDRTFMGLDLSTQQLKACVLNDNLDILCEESVNFDSDLPEFRTHGGVIIGKDNANEITAPVLMWIKALDMIMDKLILRNVDFSKIAAISGTAQQHGSVYWLNGTENTLKNLDASKFLHAQLATSFSLQNSPVWMDTSTTKQCRKLEDAVGGPEELANLTGSRAYERFTGCQIAKVYETKPDAYNNTERISLVSSFLASLFLGKYAPIDFADGSGMNLMNVRTKIWDKALLEACGPDLEKKLGDTVPSSSVVGVVSQYFVERFGFKDTCKVVAFTGDNAASLIGLRLLGDWVGVSLGTSDTLFLWLQQPKTILNGHLFCNPIEKQLYMALLCFKNGSLTRERIRNTYAEKSWETFDKLLESTPRGNFGNIGLYYDNHEILPATIGDYRYNKNGEKLIKFSSPEMEIRAAVEGQFLSRRVYAEDIGLQIGKGMKILATGGASTNKAILQVLADVFDSPVYVQEAVNSAMLGAAYQAKVGLLGSQSDYQTVTSCLPTPQLACTPYKDAGDVYGKLSQRLRDILAKFN